MKACRRCTAAGLAGFGRSGDLLALSADGTLRVERVVADAATTFRVGLHFVPFPPHVADRIKEASALYELVQEQGRSGYAGIVQGEKALARVSLHADGDRDPYGEGSFPRPQPLGEEVAP